jgi:hypothetical protein
LRNGARRFGCGSTTQEAQTYLGQAAGRRLCMVSERLCEYMQVMPQGDASTVSSTPRRAERFDQMNNSLLPDPQSRRSCSGHPACILLAPESRVRGMQPCRYERHSPQNAGAVFFSSSSRASSQLMGLGTTALPADEGAYDATNGGVLSEPSFFYDPAQQSPYELTHVRASPGDCAAGWAQAARKI